MRGLRHHTGLIHGTPFHTSTSASYGPMCRINSLPTARGNTE